MIRQAPAPSPSTSLGKHDFGSGTTVLDDFLSFRVIEPAGREGFSAVVRVWISSVEISAAMDGTILWIPAAAEDAEFVVVFPEEIGDDKDQGWSPDGKQVAYILQEPATSDGPVGVGGLTGLAVIDSRVQFSQSFGRSRRDHWWE